MGRCSLALYLVLWLARCLLEIALKWLPLLKWMAVKAQVGHSHYKKEKNKTKQKPVRANGRGARATAAPAAVVTMEALLEPRFTPWNAKTATRASR